MASHMNNIAQAYYRHSLRGPAAIFMRYWNAYGGFLALVKSPYLHVSVVLLIITSHYWLFSDWWEQPLSIVPNMLGFSLGGLAVFVGFSEKEFQAILATTKNDDKASVFLGVCSTYIHFIIVQILALVAAIIAKAVSFPFHWPSGLASFVSWATALFGGAGYLLFLYAIASMLAAAMSLFRVVSWYQAYHEKNQGKT